MIPSEHIKKLKIDSTLWANPKRIINLLGFDPKILSIYTELNSINNTPDVSSKDLIEVYEVRYDDGGFYLVIDGIKCYFNVDDNVGSILNMILTDDQKNKYQVWKEIFKNVNDGNGELMLHQKIRLIDSNFPIEKIFKIHSINIVIKSLIEKDNKFYLELVLNRCLFEPYKEMISIKIKDPLFTYRAQLVNILDFNPKKLSIEKVCAINDEKEYIYYIKYGEDPFYLVINDLKGYFKYSKQHKKELEFIIEDQKQAKIYNQIWNKIKELINSVDGVNFGFSEYLEIMVLLYSILMIPYH